MRGVGEGGRGSERRRGREGGGEKDRGDGSRANGRRDCYNASVSKTKLFYMIIGSQMPT